MVKLSVDRAAGFIMLAVRTDHPSVLPDAINTSGCELCNNRGNISASHVESICNFDSISVH